MIARRNYLWVFVLAAASLWLKGCIEPFSPPEVNSDAHYLVVDGYLNIGGDTSRIELRRTQNASEKTNPLIERGASVNVEGEKGEMYPFTEMSPGVYVLPSQNFDKRQKYRVNITTVDRKEYQSDFVVVSDTPPIDSITYRLDTFLNSMLFMVNTHDATGNTRFYRWKFEDTYEYYAPYYSALMVKDSEVVNRPEDINHCWKTGYSANIILGSTIKLSKDEIRSLPINSVPVETNKLLVKYSIKVKQYGLTREAFEYWTALAKTTQTTGSLFDPQPSQVTGNIKNKADNKELVFGYFSAGVEQTKRIFAAPRLGYYERCEPDTLPVQCGPPDEECVFNTQKLLITYIGMSHIMAVPPACADCRLKGGINSRPSFWEQ